MSKSFDHKTTFPDTHRRFRPAIEISMSIPIVCVDLELIKSNLKNKTCLDTQPINEHFETVDFSKKQLSGPYVKKEGLSDAQFRIEIASELCIR